MFSASAEGVNVWFVLARGVRVLVAALSSILLVSGCPRPHAPLPGTGSGAVCPDDSTLTYDTFGQSFMTTYCTHCHSSALAGAERLSAPSGVDFDTLADVRERADWIDAQAASGPARTNGVMPPSAPVPSTAERAALGEWLACGAP